MIEAFTCAGFGIEAIQEPMPLPEARTLFPTEYERLSTRPNASRDQEALPPAAGLGGDVGAHFDDKGGFDFDVFR
jgi:hypothetical protein